MKKQLIQALWLVASGQPQQQGEKTVYPSIREQLSAIKLLISMDDWEELPPVATVMEEKPIAQATPSSAKEVPTVTPPATEVVDTPQRPTTRPTRGTYEEWLAQKELLERLLLEEKTKKIQAKLGKMTKSQAIHASSSKERSMK